MYSIAPQINNANLAFTNSRIPLEIVFHCKVRTNIGEAPNSHDRMREFKESRGKEHEFSDNGIFRHFANIQLLIKNCVI